MNNKPHRKPLDLSRLPKKDQETAQEILDYLADFEKAGKVLGSLNTIKTHVVHVPTKMVVVPTKIVHVPTKMVVVPTKLQVTQTTALVIQNTLTERKK